MIPPRSCCQRPRRIDGSVITIAGGSEHVARRFFFVLDEPFFQDSTRMAQHG